MVLVFILVQPIILVIRYIGLEEEDARRREASGPYGEGMHTATGMTARESPLTKLMTTTTCSPAVAAASSPGSCLFRPWRASPTTAFCTCALWPSRWPSTCYTKQVGGGMINCSATLTSSARLRAERQRLSKHHRDRRAAGITLKMFRSSPGSAGPSCCLCTRLHCRRILAIWRHAEVAIYNWLVAISVCVYIAAVIGTRPTEEDHHRPCEFLLPGPARLGLYRV